MSEEYTIHGVTFDADEDAIDERPADRIAAMEAALDEVIAANEEIGLALLRYTNAQDQAAELARYLGSDAWFADCDIQLEWRCFAPQRRQRHLSGKRQHNHKCP